MRVLPSLMRSAICVIASGAFIAGCGGSQLPAGSPGSTFANPAVEHPGNERPWMDPSAKGRDLLYVSLGAVTVYSYPFGGLLGTLGVGGNYLCSDRFGNIFITSFSGGNVYVYGHGETKPKAIVYYDYETSGCSVDPNSETLAVTGAFTGGFVVFPYNRRRGWRYGHIYVDPNIFDYVDCAYDNQGNLFIDGLDLTQSFSLIELPKGSKTFTTINLNQSISTPASLQWSNGYLAVADPGQGTGPVVIYRFAINGSSGTKVSTTHLSQSFHGQFWIQGDKVIGPLFSGSVQSIGFWNFPAGGSPIKNVSSNNSSPVGVTVSLK